MLIRIYIPLQRPYPSSATGVQLLRSLHVRKFVYTCNIQAQQMQVSLYMQSDQCHYCSLYGYSAIPL